MVLENHGDYSKQPQENQVLLLSTHGPQSILALPRLHVGGLRVGVHSCNHRVNTLVLGHEDFVVPTRKAGRIQGT